MKIWSHSPWRTLGFAGCLLLFAGVLMSSSCAMILGVRDPERLEQNGFLSYLGKSGLEGQEVHVMSPATLDSLKGEAYKPGWERGFRPLQFKCFDAHNRLVSQYSTCEGPLKKLEIFSRFPPLNVFPFDSTLTLERELHMYRPYQVTNPILNAEYTCVVYFASWLGWPGRNFLGKVRQYLSTHGNKQVRVIFVNLAEQ